MPSHTQSGDPEVDPEVEPAAAHEEAGMHHVPGDDAHEVHRGRDSSPSFIKARHSGSRGLQLYQAVKWWRRPRDECGTRTSLLDFAGPRRAPDAMKERASRSRVQSVTSSSARQTTGRRPCHGLRRSGSSSQVLSRRRARGGDGELLAKPARSRSTTARVPAGVRGTRRGTCWRRLRGYLRLGMVRRSPFRRRHPGPHGPSPRHQGHLLSQGEDDTRSTPRPWPTCYARTCFPGLGRTAGGPRRSQASLGPGSPLARSPSPP